MIIRFLHSLFWIVVGVAAGIVLNDPLRKVLQKSVYRYRRWRLGRGVPAIPPPEGDYRVGKWRVGWVVVVGSCADPFKPKNIVCKFNPQPLKLSEDTVGRKKVIERQQSEIERKEGRRLYHPGPTASLLGIKTGQIGDDEEPLLVLDLQKTDYYTFLATAMKLDNEITKDNGGTNNGAGVGPR